MYLNDLFEDAPRIEINQLSIDSRVPMKDCIFFCLSGIKDNGHNFVKEAIKNGASVIVYEKEMDTNYDAIFINVNNVADCLNNVASKFYGYPSRKMETYITCGCDGCNSINYLLKSLLSNYKSTASIGSNGIYYKDHYMLFNYPTLTILDNQKYLSTFLKEKIEACVFESNAQSLYYKKLNAINPNVFIYTYTNNDSTEYKEVGSKYSKVILNYLYSLDNNTNIILNRDDVFFEEFVKACGERTYSYGLSEFSDYQIKDIKLYANKSTFVLKFRNIKMIFTTKFIGMYNIYNIAAVLAALDLMGYDLNDISMLLPFIEPYTGVLESINLGQNFNVIIDSAKNVNIIESILELAKEVTNNDSNIYVVYGINTNDDEDKIEEVCKCISKYTDKLILTENYTYNEDIHNFLEDNKSSFKDLHPLIIDNREIAIESSIELMNKNDTLLILGKGNEKYIYRNMGKEVYDGDSEIVKKFIKKRLDEENSFF